MQPRWNWATISMIRIYSAIPRRPSPTATCADSAPEKQSIEAVDFAKKRGWAL
jgi:hypothetical protein